MTMNLKDIRQMSTNEIEYELSQTGYGRQTMQSKTEIREFDRITARLERVLAERRGHKR